MKERRGIYVWCNVAAVVMLLLGFASMISMVTRTGQLTPPSALGAVGILASVVVPLAFILFVLPIAESGHGSVTGSRSPQRLRNGIVGAVWLPFLVLLSIEGLVLSGRLSGVGLVDDAATEQSLRAWWLPVCIAIACAYAAIYTVVVIRRIGEVVQRNGLCFSCGYRVTDIPNCRKCPECGTAVSTSAPAKDGTT